MTAQRLAVTLAFCTLLVVVLAYIAYHELREIVT